IVLASRPEVAPGQLKTTPNRAGDTRFVDPAYVVGTLRHGYELYRDLAPGLARAIFMLVLVSEVHPFVDGNGRLARIMMNAELRSVGHSTIIIPTLHRDDYMTALRAFSRRDRTRPVI